MVALKITEVQSGHPLDYSSQTGVLVGNGVAEAVAGGVEIGKQPFDVTLRRVAIGGAFNGGKYGGQIGVQALIGVGAFGNIGKQLAWVDEVALGFNGIIFDVRGDNVI